MCREIFFQQHLFKRNNYDEIHETSNNRLAVDLRVVNIFDTVFFEFTSWSINIDVTFPVVRYQVFINFFI